MQITNIESWRIPTPMPENLEFFFEALDLEWIQDIPYKKVGDTILTLDVLRPRKIDNKLLPTVLCIHGGAWRKGTNKNYNGATFSANGYVTFNIRYRLTGEAPYPANLEDCMDALHWIKQHGMEYGADVERIAVRGGSSGAHLALMMALHTKEGELSAVVAACAPSHLPSLYQSTIAANSFFAQRDAATLVQTFGKKMDSLLECSCSNTSQQILEEKLNIKGFASAFDMLLGYEVDEDVSALEPMSPWHLLDQMDTEDASKMPPFLLLHGLADPLVPVYQTLLLKEKMVQKGVRVEMELFPNAKHDYMFDNGLYRPERMAKILAFLDREMKRNI